MELQIAKWGNSLAMRLPAAVVRRLKLRAGDTVHAEVLANGALAIRTENWSRAAFAAELRAAHAEMPSGTAVVEQMRRDARY